MSNTAHDTKGAREPMKRIYLPNNLLGHCIENKFDAFDETRKMLGLSRHEFQLLFEVLNKCIYAHTCMNVREVGK